MKDNSRAIYRVKNLLHKSGATEPDWTDTRIDVTSDKVVDDNALVWQFMHDGYEPNNPYVAGNKIGVLIDDKICIYEAQKEANAETVYSTTHKTGTEETPGFIGTFDSSNGKIILNGQLLIIRGDKVYTITGQEVR